MQDLIERNRDRIAELCRRHQVRSLALFGSAARDDFDPERSDIDLLVEFEVSGEPRTDCHESLKRCLIELFAHRVDLIQAGTIRNPYIRSDIASQQVTLYAA